MKKYIATNNAPAAIGPYSQAVEVNGFIFCAGQVGMDPKSNELKEGLVEQTKQVLANIEAVLAAAGLDKTAIVKTTVYLQNMNDFQQMNETYAAFFVDHKPARATVEVAKLPKNALIEIEAIACR